jgi:hypothetical protein
VPVSNVLVAHTKFIGGIGSGLTVNDFVVEQPVAVRVYLMIAVPPASVVIIPVVLPILATPGVTDVHVPPALALNNVSISVAQYFTPPIIGEGIGLTVTDV